MSASVQLLVGMVVIAGYYLLGAAVVRTGIFESSQANPVLDYIYWMGGTKLLWLWPIWLVLWLIAWPFSNLLWPYYVPHTNSPERRSLKPWYWFSDYPPRS